MDLGQVVNELQIYLMKEVESAFEETRNTKDPYDTVFAAGKHYGINQVYDKYLKLINVYANDLLSETQKLTLKIKEESESLAENDGIKGDEGN